MSRLDGLIRLHRWQLDEHRRRTVELEALRQTTIERIQALDEAVAKEAAAVGSDLASQAAYRAYAARARAQQAKLAETLDTLETEIAEAQSAVTAAFQELKKYELARETRRQRQQETLLRRERAALDEIAIEAFRRNGSNGRPA